jgi:hypothetical protein
MGSPSEGSAMITTIQTAREISSLPPRANSPASAGVFYSCLANPFCFAGPLGGDEVETVAPIGQADAMASTSESGLDELTFAYVTGGVRAALDREVRKLRSASC